MNKDPFISPHPWPSSCSPIPPPPPQQWWYHQSETPPAEDTSQHFQKHQYLYQPGPPIKNVRYYKKRLKLVNINKLSGHRLQVHQNNNPSSHNTKKSPPTTPAPSQPSLAFTRTPTFTIFTIRSRNRQHVLLRHKPNPSTYPTRRQSLQPLRHPQVHFQGTLGCAALRTMRERTLWVQHDQTWDAGIHTGILRGTDTGAF